MCIFLYSYNEIKEVWNPDMIKVEERESCHRNVAWETKFLLESPASYHFSENHLTEEQPFPHNTNRCSGTSVSIIQ